MSLRLVFAGTPDFALPSLEACLASAFEVVSVYTQPDRRSGRGRKQQFSPVKQAALAAGVPVAQPRSLKTPEARDELRQLAPDLMVVVAYGQILPQAVLDIPTHGCWNVHASLLPRWRGAAPIQRAIAAGDETTGVALMQLEAGLDTGPVLLQEAIDISADDTGGSLHDRLARLGGDVLAHGLAQLAAGQPPQATPQADEGVTYARKLDKSEAVLDLDRPAAELARLVRAFNPWPVAETRLAGERLRVYAADARTREADARPGDILAADAEGIDLACGEGILRLTQVQRDGGRPMAVRDYLNARPELRQATA